MVGYLHELLSFHVSLPWPLSRVFITKGRGVAHFSRAGTCELRYLWVLHVSHVPRWGLLVVHAGSVGMSHHIVRDVGPELRLLARPMRHVSHHLGRFHVSDHGMLVRREHSSASTRRLGAPSRENRRLLVDSGRSRQVDGPDTIEYGKKVLRDQRNDYHTLEKNCVSQKATKVLSFCQCCRC